MPGINLGVVPTLLIEAAGGGDVLTAVNKAVADGSLQAALANGDVAAVENAIATHLEAIFPGEAGVIEASADLLAYAISVEPALASKINRLKTAIAAAKADSAAKAQTKPAPAAGTGTPAP